MAIPHVKQNAERPSGALPGYTQYIVLGIIAVLILAATFWGGGNKPRKAEQQATPPAPTPNQLQSVQQMLERRRQEAAEQAARQHVPTPTVQAPTVASAPAKAPAPDFVNEQNRQRPATVLASSYVVRPAPPPEVAPLDLTTQIVEFAPSPSRAPVAPNAQAGTGVQGGAEGKKDSVPGPKESGRRLPPREGELHRLYEGTLVHAMLANGLDGAFTGPVNCTVSAPVLSEDRTETLIPAGSRFIGRASKVEAENQTRLAVTFKRLLLPNGYSVDLESAPGLDDAGETGLKGKVDNHNLRKFGLSGAIGLLGGLALYGGRANPYASGVANSTGGSATNILNHALNSVPTITVPKGHPVNIYLPGDLLLPPYRP